MSGYVWPVDALPSSGEEIAQQPGLRAVDEHVCATDSRGILALRTSSPEMAAALERHIARRIAATERATVRTSTEIANTDPSCWRDACAQLGISDIPADPVAAARTLCEAAHGSVILVLGRVRDGSWDQAVLHALDRTPSRALIVLIRWGDPEMTGVGEREEIYVGGSRDDLQAWWGGVVQEAMARHDASDAAPNMVELDTWWSWSSRRLDDAPQPDLSTLSEEAMSLIARLRLAGRAWPSRFKEMLGARSAWFELVDLGLVVQHAGHLRLTPSSAAVVHEPAEADRIRVADTLRTRFDKDAWALARAGVLYMGAGRPDHGQACLQQALRTLDDALARHEVWDGWRQALAQLPSEGQTQGAMFAAELALERDDVDTALELAHLAGGGDANAPFQAHYVLGRAQLARGDVVAARGSLERAFARGASEDDR
ncbi:MAG: tetratricopeptide repeat protein, partial [Myxococcota bacterium]